MKEKEGEALARCEELVEEISSSHEAPLSRIQHRRQLSYIYFKSEKRVDFRALLRELSNTLKTRVELRPGGTRDAAKLVAAWARCGRSLCCSSHLWQVRNYLYENGPGAKLAS